MRRPLPPDRIEGLLEPERGLAREEAAARLARFGPNQVIEAPPHPWRELVRETAKDPMPWFLAGTGALYAALGERAEALTLLASILPLVGMDAFLHRRTRAATEGLRRRLATHARVVRDGLPVAIASEQIVPGDLVRMAPGETFPADGLLLAGDEMQVDESALTGEAFPVRKRPLPAGPTGASIDARHWGFAGTRLLTGSASLRVVVTGGETWYGEILRSAAQTSRARTPLQISIAGLTRTLLVAALVLCVVLAGVRLRQGFGWLDALVSAATLAVAALPEEFPVVFALFLGVGVHRLAQRRALVRRAVCVENIGRITCVCSDKTGTLTAGELRLAHLLPAREGSEAELLRAGARASRSESGDPLDAAILAAAGAPPGAERVATFPFTEDRRRETAVLREPGGELTAATKGSPEVVLALATLPPIERETWTLRVRKLAAGGHKVIACASRRLDGAWAGGEPDRGFRFEGLLACEDPVRAGAADALARCREAGIQVIMVTGDHPDTARAVAQELGLGGGRPRLVAGEEIDALVAGGDAAALAGLDVAARALPSQKLALVRALQKAGGIVAVTGDGVHDVPALQAADIGIAMGERGTRGAREVASIVLLDDDFSSIARAIAEGRQLLVNLRLAFRYLMLVHVPFVVSAAWIPLLGHPLPFLPIHVVWLELVIHPSAMLAFQQVAPGGAFPPARRRAEAAFFTRADWLWIAGLGSLLTLLVVAGFEHGLTGELAHARSFALAILVCASAGLTAALSRLRTRAARLVVAVTLLATIALLEVPALAGSLHLAPLGALEWGLALAAGGVAAAPLLAASALARRRDCPRGGAGVSSAPSEGP
ncbi:MAG: cation-translocating P-type ATPase [Candidatus Limnocylindria bacterium]